MKFTSTSDEEFIGMEFCCDLCNKKPTPPTAAFNWWYVRYKAKAVFPSLWVCPECAFDLNEGYNQNEINKRA